MGLSGTRLRVGQILAARCLSRNRANSRPISRVVTVGPASDGAWDLPGCSGRASTDLDGTFVHGSSWNAVAGSIGDGVVAPILA